MLSTLAITNLAVIDSLEVRFEAGLNIFTGETGAGKSIILSALSLILGERASSDLIRSGCDTARVVARFGTGSDAKIARVLEEAGVGFLPVAPGPRKKAEPRQPAVDLEIERAIHREGKNRCRVNGESVTLATLRQLGDLLVDLHGQHEHQRLLDPRHHLELVDSFGDADHHELVASVAQDTRRVTDLARRIADLADRGKRREQELDLARAQRDEIESACVDPVTDGFVETRLKLLSNLERVRREAAEVVSGLSAEEGEGAGALSTLRSLGPRLEFLESTCADESMTKAAAALREATFLLEDVASTVRRTVDGLELDEEELAKVEARVGVLTRLKRKYGPGLDDVVAHGRTLAGTIEALEGETDDLERLEAQRRGVVDRVTRETLDLSARRRRIADSLEQRADRHLNDLGLEQSQFRVCLSRQPDPDSPVVADGERVHVYPDGIDRAEFLFAPNPGEPAKSLTRIASGGELSRVMLAIKSSLAVLDRVPIMVFDEIDSGIGGTTAVKVAEKLRQVSSHCQSLVITHLPQIASAGAVHFAVEKSVENGRTLTCVRRLGPEERIRELQRMLGGPERVSREHARELLANLSTAG